MTIIMRPEFDLYVLARILFARVLLLLATAAYALSLIYCLDMYAGVKWPQYGFSFRPMSASDAILLGFSIFIWCLVLPLKIDRPSSLFLIVIFTFVCVPAAVSMVSIKDAKDGYFYPLLISLGIGFFVACIMVRCFSWSSVSREVSNGLVYMLALMWLFAIAFLIYSFGEVIRFSGLHEIYVQRVRGAAGSLFEGYVQTYFGYFLSPALLVFGMARRSLLLKMMGGGGAVVLYMITAEKAALMYPVFIIVFYFVFSRMSLFLYSAAIAFFFSFILFFSVLFCDDLSLAEFVSWYLGVRSLLIPGTFVAHYFSYFSDQGFTALSHITGMSVFVSPPDQLATHPRWPSIGYLVGEDYFGIPTLNANANFIAWDGVASFGELGVLLSLLFFALFLIVLDWSARGISSLVSVVMLVPLALTLTNGSLFTAMVSFGGAAFLMIFFLAKKKFPDRTS